MKNKENIENATRIVFFVFSKTVLKNSFRKQESNMPFRASITMKGVEVGRT